MTPKNPMRTFNPLRLARQRRRGAVTLLVAGSMVVLCGMAALAVDYGMMVSTKNQLQRACDAAALAAVSYLPGDPSQTKETLKNARTAAVFYASQNGNVVVLPGQVTFPDEPKGTPQFRVTVRAARNVAFLFAPILPGNPQNGNVRASATAAVQLRDRLNTPAVAPLGITPETYAAGLASGQSVYIRLIEQNKEGLGLNGMVAFDLRDGSNGKSPAKLEDQLQWDTSFNEPSYIGHPEVTLVADDQAQSKPTNDGVKTRFDAARALGDYGTSYPNIPRASPRVVYMIVTPSTPGGINGTNMAQVVAFAPVYLEELSVTSSSGTTTVLLKAHMLPPRYDSGHVSDGGGYSDATTDSPTALRIARLVE